MITAKATSVKVLKTCNCCLTHKAEFRHMGRAGYNQREGHVNARDRAKLQRLIDRTANGSQPYHVSTDRCIKLLVAKGLLGHTPGKGYTAPHITAEGLAAL